MPQTNIRTQISKDSRTGNVVIRIFDLVKIGKARVKTIILTQELIDDCHSNLFYDGTCLLDIEVE